jgi:hypothetical protein
MMRSLSKSIAGLLPLLLVGCAADLGLPWGEVEATIEAGLEVPSDRLRPQGLATASGYVVQLTSLAVTSASVTFTVDPPGADSSFDPANPPEGFSLCHNGHCHAADGSLVDYDIVALSAGGAGRSTRLVPAAAQLQPPLPSGQAATAPLSLGCSDDLCRYDRGELSSIALRLAELRMAGRIFDGGSGGSLPADGAPFDLIVALDTEVTAAAQIPFGPDDDPGVKLGIGLALPISLIDAITPDSVADPTLFAPLAETKVREAAKLNLSVARSSL